MKKSKKILAGVLSASLLLGTLAAPLTAFAAATAELKVAAISDLNYGATTDAYGLMYSKSGAILDAALAKIDSAKADVLLVTGDLTYNGTLAEHQAVAAKLAAVEAKGVDVLVVPGERDVAKAGVNAGAVTDAQFKATYANLGYDKTTAADTSGLSYVADVDGHKLLMLDSVADATAESAASKGRGAIDATWAAAKATAGNVKLAAAHHPSVSRGSTDSVLIGLLYTVAGIKDADGNPMYTGDPFAGLDIVDKSAFSYGDMQKLATAGVATIFTGHSGAVNTVTGSADLPANAPEGTVAASWTDYNVGSMATAAASVTFVKFDAADAQVADSFALDRVTTAAGIANLHDAAVTAAQANVPTMVNGMIDQLMYVYPNLINILKPIVTKFIDGMSIGSGFLGGLTDAIAKDAVKKTANNVFNLIGNVNVVRGVIDEIKDGLLASSVSTSTGTVGMHKVLAEVQVQLAEDHNLVAPSLRDIVADLKAEAPTKTLINATIDSFISNFAGTKTINLVNAVLGQKLTITVLFIPSSHTIREMLYGPVSFFGNTIDLWSIIDGFQPYMPDGTLVPPELRPSAVAKPLVTAILMKNATTAQDVAGFKTAVSANKDALVDLFLRMGIAGVI